MLSCLARRSANARCRPRRSSPPREGMCDGLIRSAGWSLRLLRQRQAITDQKAAFRCALDSDRPAMSRSDLCRDRQPEAGAGAVVFSTPESCCGPGYVTVRQANATVADHQVDGLARPRRRHGHGGALSCVTQGVLQCDIEQLLDVVTGELDNRSGMV